MYVYGLEAVSDFHIPTDSSFSILNHQIIHSFKYCFMKKQMPILFTLLLSFCVIYGYAQETPWKPAARGQSGNGYWVVQVHQEHKDQKLVTFYTKDNHLMYQEIIKNEKFNINKEKTVTRLNHLLDSIAVEWEKEKKFNGQILVQATFKQ
jgi:hypothetical protein